MCYDPLRLYLCFLICSTDLPLLTQPGSRLTRRRPSHHPAREEFGSWCEGCCGCERASACEKLELVYQHLLGRLLLVKAAAKALCLIRRGLVIKGAPNHFFCRGPCLHEGKPHSGASAARAWHAVVVLVGLCFSNKPTCADAIRDSVVGSAIAGPRVVRRNLVDPASSHMLVSKIKPCMSQYKLLYGETANGSLKQL